MTTRRRWHVSVLAAAALIVAGCGGGSTDAPLASRVVVFGDSLSDIGAYTPATSLTATAGAAPYFGGKWTTNTFAEYTLPPAGGTRAPNTSTAVIWVEWIAARLGVALTPHEVGFGPQSVICPAAATSPSLATSCTGYAQGGARITNPAGVGNPNGTGLVGANPVPFTRPLVRQVADHLARFSGFSDDDIVFVFGGANDAIIQFTTVAPTSPTDAVTNMRTAGTELATLIKDQVLANGAERVVWMTVPDLATTPAFAARSAPEKALLSTLTAEFNAAVQEGLAGTAVKTIDIRAFSASLQANPASYGLVNTTLPACDAAKIAVITANRVTDGTSLFCNASPGVAFNGLRTGASASTWLFADGVHPTTGAHRLVGDHVWAKLKEFGWAPDNL